jgi:hypothetical protein
MVVPADQSNRIAMAIASLFTIVSTPAGNSNTLGFIIIWDMYYKRRVKGYEGWKGEREGLKGGRGERGRGIESDTDGRPHPPLFPCTLAPFP